MGFYFLRRRFGLHSGRVWTFMRSGLSWMSTDMLIFCSGSMKSFWMEANVKSHWIRLYALSSTIGCIINVHGTSNSLGNRSCFQCHHQGISIVSSQAGKVVPILVCVLKIPLSVCKYTSISMPFSHCISKICTSSRI